MGKRNFIRYEKIMSPRGNIFDCKGNLLATNRPVFALYWVGTGKRSLDEDQRSVLQLLETIFTTSFTPSTLTSAERTYKQFLLIEDIPFEALSKLVEQLPHHKNLLITSHFKRYYPYNSLASQTIGYLGALQTDWQGKMGLEKVCDEQLKGAEGQLLKTINSIGKHLDQQEVKKALAGSDIHCTMDLVLQEIAEAVFPEDYAGVLLLMDPQNGALKVMVSRPGFDPNTFLTKISSQRWEDMQYNNPFINRIFDACYPPASLFKLVTIAAALETQLITPDDTWFCQGAVIFADRPYHCSNRYGHGKLSLIDALGCSCNVPFFEMGKRLKIDTLAHYASLFGLGTKTESIFPEKIGLIPSTHWKRTVKKERWWAGETLSATIGQISLVTPIQIVRMISAICQGYLVKPRILLNEEIEITPLDIMPTTQAFLKKCMKRVIEQGGSAYQKLRKFSKTMKLYAKTGTAQTASLAYSKDNPLMLEHAWFAVYFIDQNNQPHTLVIVIERAGSSRVAVSVAEQFLKKYQELIEQKS
jgi:penicillin-binding protein 2